MLHRLGLSPALSLCRPIATMPGNVKPLFVLVIVESVNIFANPIAGRGKGQSIAQRLATRLQADGLAVRTFFDPPASLTADAVGETVVQHPHVGFFGVAEDGQR